MECLDWSLVQPGSPKIEIKEKLCSTVLHVLFESKNKIDKYKGRERERDAGGR